VTTHCEIRLKTPNSRLGIILKLRAPNSQTERSVIADVRYSHGFTNALDKSVGDIGSWYSRDIRLMAGVLFHLTE